MAYVRGGLCAIVAFRERDKGNDSGSPAVVSPQGAASASASASSEVPIEEKVVEAGGQAEDESDGGGGWSERRVRPQATAAAKSKGVVSGCGSDENLCEFLVHPCSTASSKEQE